MFKDPGNQSYWRAGIGGFFSLMSAQELLALVSLVIGAVTIGRQGVGKSLGRMLSETAP